LDEEKLNKEEKRKKGFWYWIRRNFYPILLIFSAFIIILTITLIMLTRAQWFRYWVSGLVFTVVNNELQDGAKFEFKDIGFSYLLGIKLYDVSLTYKGDTLLYSKEFVAGLKVAPLLRNKIIVNEVVLYSPKINFYRSAKDSLWVIEKILKPSTDTTVSEPADWLIQVKKIRFRDGDLRFYDSTIAHNITNKLDMDHFRLKSFYLSMNAEIDLKKSKYKAEIKELSFYDKYSGNKVKELEMTASLDSNGANIEDMFLRTSNSEFELNTDITKFNVFDDADIEKARFKINMTSTGLNIDEISRFIPADIPVSGNCSFSMQASGKLNHFFTRFQDLNFGRSNMTFSANIMNVIDDNRMLEFDFEDSRLLKENLDVVIKKLGIENIPDFGDMTIHKLKGTFRMDSIYSEFDVKSSLGNASGIAGVGIKDTLSYSGKVSVQNLDLSKVLLEPAYSSNVNADIDFTGSGDSPEILKMSIKMNMIDSKVMDYKFNNFILNASTQERGKILIDTLLIGFGEPFRERTDDTLERRIAYEKISMSGFVDIHDMKKPKYDLTATIRNINPAEIFQSKDIPEHLNANIQLNGEGFEPDSMNTSIEFSVTEWKLRGKKLKPLHMKLSINRGENHIKSLILNSDIAKLDLKGNFSYLELMNRLLLDFDNLHGYTQNKINDIFPDKVRNEIIVTANAKQFIGENNFDLSCNLKDNELIKSFLKYNKFDCDVGINISYNSKENLSNIKISEFKIDKFIFDDGENSLQLFPSKMDGGIKLDYSFGTSFDKLRMTENDKLRMTDSNTTLGKVTISPDIDFNFVSRAGVNYGDMTISGINSKIKFADDNLMLLLEGELNDMFKLSSNAEFVIDRNHIDISFDKLKFQYSNKIGFSIEEPISMIFQNNEITFNKFKLISDKLDFVDLKGTMGENYFKNLNLKVKNYDIENIWEFVPRDEIELGYELKGNVDSLSLLLDGSFDKTDFDLRFDIGKLAVGESYFGNISSNLRHRNSVLSGEMRFYNPLLKTKSNYLKLTLGKIPVNMSIDAEGDRFYENNPIALTLETTQFPLKVLSPFITEVKNLSGYADIGLDITGDGIKNLKYKGSLAYSNAQFLLEANNMSYFSDGKIRITTDTINVERISVKNHPTDIANGEAIAKGKIILDNLEPREFDLKVFSNRFKVLSQASMKSMPSLYGDFVIAFGPRPIHFYGTTDAPYLSGDVNIVRAALVMPNTSSIEVRKSVLKYEIKQDSTIEFSLVPDSSSDKDSKTKIAENKQKPKKGDEKSFGDLLDIDVGIKFKGRFFMTMDITGIGQLFAEIGTQNPEDELRYVMKRGAEEAQVYGTDIYVKDGSTLKLIKMLDTKGKVSFSKGLVSNPGLDLVATYNGQRVLPDRTEKYKVNMYIKGTKDQPNISFGYSIDDKEETGDSSRINENALLLLTLGKTKEELQSSSSTGGKVDYMASASSIASSMASSALTDFVQASSFIQSADIDIGSSLQNMDEARMKFSGDIKGIKWTLGGSVAQFANSNELSIDFPLSSILNIKGTNIVFQLTKVTSSAQASTTKNQKDFEIKLRIGGNW